MGIFDFIGKKMQQAGEEAQAAQMRAENWDTLRICKELQRTSKISIGGGYARVLKIRCREMDDYNLKMLFERLYRDGNLKAINMMMPEMEARGLAYRSEGRIIKNY